MAKLGEWACLKMRKGKFGPAEMKWFRQPGITGQPFFLLFPNAQNTFPVRHTWQLTSENEIVYKNIYYTWLTWMVLLCQNFTGLPWSLPLWSASAYNVEIPFPNLFLLDVRAWCSNAMHRRWRRASCWKWWEIMEHGWTWINLRKMIDMNKLNGLWMRTFWKPQQKLI